MAKAIEKELELGYPSGNMIIKTMGDAIKYLNAFIQPPGGLGDGAHNFLRMKELMNRLGNPQNTLKVIHIAGTSGKGSTSVVISTLLRSHGFKVGLTVSPHLLDLRERTQINNHLLTAQEYCKNLSEIMPAIESMKNSTYDSPSFFEITMAHAFYTFQKEKVDYAVVETGMGGRYDATNVVEREDKLAVITRIGLDHTEFLGDTIVKIATEKAHIIQSGNHVLSVPQEKEARNVIERICHEKKAALKFIEVQPSITSSLDGEYQKENLSLAMAAAYELSKRDAFHYDLPKVRHALQNIYFPGRFDIREIAGKKVILDGAHNPQKMQAFIQSLIKKYPQESFDFLVAFRKGKDFREMLHYIIPYANSITVTEFALNDQGMHTQAEEAKLIKEQLMSLQYTNVLTILDSQEAFSHVVKNSAKKIVGTGSLYLISELYSYINDIHSLS